MVWWIILAASIVLLVLYAVSRYWRFLIVSIFSWKSAARQAISPVAVPTLLVLAILVSGYSAFFLDQGNVKIVQTGTASPLQEEGETRIENDDDRPLIQRLGQESEAPSRDTTFQNGKSKSQAEVTKGPRQNEKFRQPPPPPPRIIRTPISPNVTREPPESVFSFSTNIVSDKTDEPIRGAKIALGHESDVSDDDGAVEMLLSRKPDPDDVLRVGHGEYVSHVFRYDNLAARKEVRLKSKYRLLVVEFGDPAKSSTQVVRKAAEGQLTTCREIELLAEDKRNEIVAQLFKYQEERALYDKATLAKVGNFLGATHGVFGSITNKTSGAVELECSLVHLESATQEATARMLLSSESFADAGSKLLMDQLLAELTEVKILSPLDGMQVSRKISVSGYGLFLPASWTLWISIMPLDSSQHYPQMRLTVQEDGSWMSPGVQIGNDDPRSTNPKFAVYAVLTNPDATARIEQYHERIKMSPGSNDGLDLASWGDDCCKVLHRIVVIPEDK